MKWFLKCFLVFTVVSGVAEAKTCNLEISGNDMMQFDKATLKVNKSKCSKVKLTLKHSGKKSVISMGHNWILVKTDDFSSVMVDAMKAGADKNYVPVDRSKVIAATKLIGGKDKPKSVTSTSVTFSTKKLKKGGDYTYFCGFPAHAMMMKGKFIVE